jgi:hypothetical protein
VAVSVGGRYVGTVDLRKGAYRRDAVVTLPVARGTANGRVTVTVVSSGRPVEIDGIAVSPR